MTTAHGIHDSLNSSRQNAGQWTSLARACASVVLPDPGRPVTTISNGLLIPQSVPEIRVGHSGPRRPPLIGGYDLPLAPFPVRGRVDGVVEGRPFPVWDVVADVPQGVSIEAEIPRCQMQLPRPGMLRTYCRQIRSLSSALRSSRSGGTIGRSGKRSTSRARSRRRWLPGTTQVELSS